MSMKRILILVGVVIVTVSSPAFAQRRATIDRALSEAAAKGDSARRRVIVRYRTTIDSDVERSFESRGNKIRRRHRAASAFTAEVRAKDLASLASDPNIEGFSDDAVVSADAGFSLSSLPALSALGLNSVRQTLGLGTSLSQTGYGVGVAVIDSGIESVKDFEGRIVASYDFTGDTATSLFKSKDTFGHGTHVAGLIGGSGFTGSGRYMGMAPAVRLISLKVLDQDGRGYTSDVLEAIDFAIANRSKLGIDVINLSLGHPILESATTDPLVQAVERASRAGLVVVAAAGNIGRDRTTGKVAYAGITSPGNAPSAITVGGTAMQNTASRADDAIGYYSSRGPSVIDEFVKPDVVAPGDNMVSVGNPLSTIELKYPKLKVGDGSYVTLSGTSMASGVVSGIVALVIEANRRAGYGYWGQRPDLSPAAVKAILQYTAIGMKDPATGVEYDTLSQGAGQVNASGAIALAAAIDTTMPVGTPWLSRSVTPSTKINGQTLAWSQRILWGHHVLGGGVMLVNVPAFNINPTHIVWGADDHIVWGADDHIVWGADDHIVWGADDHIVWGADDHIVWGADDHIVWGADDHIVWGADDHIVWGASEMQDVSKGAKK
jgi:serine protease AprX